MDQQSAAALAQAYLDSLPRNPAIGRLLILTEHSYQQPEGWVCPLQSARYLIGGRPQHAVAPGSAILVDAQGQCWRVRLKST